MRSLSIAMPTQLALEVDPSARTASQQWRCLPDATRQEVLVLLARLIARDLLAAGVVGS